MKQVYVISDFIFDTPTTKVKRYRVNNFISNSAVKSVKVKNENLIDYWKWFNSVEETVNYLESL